VVLGDGRVLSARLVVVATGPNETLTASLGMRRREGRPALQTQSFGFDLARVDGRPFPFDGCNVRGRPGDGVDFVTLFRIGATMRVNLFTVWDADDPRGREVVAAPVATLEQLFPGLTAHTGPLLATGRVQACPTHHHRLEGVEQSGVVVVGDAFQTVSPATGTGLDKVLTDVDVLCRDHLPRWLATPGMGPDKVAAFYADPRKRRVDRRSHQEWLHAQERVLRPRREAVRSVPWKLSRLVGAR
jgi:2-polyprenyl-6-methoxyphenol hydroxylase-like FAD-dependent oxidoreductase